MDAERPDLVRWNTRFSADDYLFGTAPNAFLAAQRHLLPARGRALAIADGEGRNGVFLAEQGLEVVSMDFSPVASAKARRLAERRGVPLATVTGPIEDWIWEPARYDVVAAIFIQFAPPALRERIFAGIRATLAPGGLLLLQGYRPEQLRYGTGGPPEPDRLYTEELLREAFGAFEILWLSAHDDVVEEGAGHRGMSALIDLVARKPAA